MIIIGTIRDAKTKQYDETWAIVRSLKAKTTDIEQVSDLSPSFSLFKQYRNLCDTKQWNQNTFDTIYVPQFINEIKHNDASIKRLNQLYQLDKVGKTIYLACFCPDENMCHRSIIAGLLQGVSCDVKSKANNDYRKYYELYKKS